MPLVRDSVGVWRAEVEKGEGPTNPALKEAWPRYLSAFDKLFYAAQQHNELEFLFSLFRVRSTQDPGWDPYETTIEAIPLVLDVASEVKDPVAQHHMVLWLYGHIVEASEPYELVMNLLEVANGGHYAMGNNLPRTKSGARPSPGSKIAKIAQLAQAAKLEEVAIPFTEVWDRNLRNAVFHADYALYGSSVRITDPGKEYSGQEIDVLFHRALAYQTSLSTVFRLYVSSYTEPRIIPTSAHFEGDPELQWVVIIRDGYGAAGVKDAWTSAELSRGKIRLRVGRFYEDERQMLDADPALARLSARASA